MEESKMEELREAWFKHKHFVRANYSDFSFQVDLPCGWIVKRILVIPGGPFSIDEICLIFPREGKRFLVLDKTLPVYDPLVEPNFLVIPLIGQAMGGLDLRRRATGDVKIGFTIGGFGGPRRNYLTLYYDCYR